MYDYNCSLLFNVSEFFELWGVHQHINEFSCRVFIEFHHDLLDLVRSESKEFTEDSDLLLLFKSEEDFWFTHLGFHSKNINLDLIFNLHYGLYGFLNNGGRNNGRLIGRLIDRWR